MSTPPSRPPALRVKLPCDDEKDFFARLADTIAEKGLRVPTANLRAIGSRVRVVLEFRNAQTVSGEAVVDAHVEGPRPAMNVRLVKFERSRPGATPAPALTPAPGPALTPAPGPALTPAPPPARPVGPAAAHGAGTSPPAPPKPPAPPPETSFASILDEVGEPAGPEPTPEPVPVPRPPAEGTEELEPLWEASPAPEREPPQRPAAPARAGALAAPSRRAVLTAVGVAAALGVGIVVFSVARHRAGPPSGASAAAAQAADAESKVLARIGAADRRISEGRLSGTDGALDHLLAARALRPDDARVRDRLRLLADTLEMLGGRALDRGDAAEAEVHLAAALQAAPGRPSIVAKMEAVARLPAPSEARARAGPAEKPAP